MLADSCQPYFIELMAVGPGRLSANYRVDVGLVGFWILDFVL